MNRVEMELVIADKVVDGMKAMKLLGSQKENDVRMDVVISLTKGASDENLKDMIGFIKFGQLHEKGVGWVTSNLMHDINGLANHEPCFLPRTTGYDSI